jgi:hypothetical protein
MRSIEYYEIILVDTTSIIWVRHLDRGVDEVPLLLGKEQKLLRWGDMNEQQPRLTH